ncbi:peptide chain release factor N(5)-glutamine methyltransferase [Faecalicatena contorta]|uniref:Release factor glutamine methyltransferase n=1 Tax=Faecalicatena contorta TaxID=39482 RepID=A0A316A049_9FIRM|nr:peptide chain release factor N(5)-glutamine methyltransferase [Faecalicatena contorta]PWJ50909.1 release factor glutamine methyltransferase [Faecalicatena contorta]SUQ13477.1 release factor glutamine methyltransferase [Faecalicatena contorta]
MTLKEAYQQGKDVLVKTGTPDADLDAWLLLEYVSKISRAMYYAIPDKPLTQDEESQYLHYIERRAQHIPLQHLTGVQEFMGLEFQVNEHVLIPRQDTELLAEEALKIIGEAVKGRPEGTFEPAGGRYRLLDMCTGSGCILLSILHHAGKSAKMKIKGTGADISQKALETAQANADSLHIQAEFLCSDLFEQVTGQYEMIVSNPPYIRTDVIETLQEEVKNHDPILALDGKEDGLHFYRRIIEAADKYLTKGGCLVFEIGADQGEAVSSMMGCAGYHNVIVKKDLAGLDRVVTGVYDR